MSTTRQNIKKCERCANKNAEIKCLACKPLNYFCNGCDIAVHSILTKNTHQREKFENLNYNENNHNADTNYETSTNNRDYNNFSNFSRPHSVIDRAFSTSKNFNQNLGELYSNYPITTSLNNYIASPTKCNQTINNNNNFSKDYVNNLKSIFEKEKQELINKNQATSNNLERLKSTFQEQIYCLQKQLIEVKEKSNKELMLIDEDREINITQIQKSYKQKEDNDKCLINKLCSELEQAEKMIELKNIELSELKINYQENINSMSNKITNLLKEKDDTTNHLHNQILDIKKGNSLDINNAISHYEQEINSIMIDFDSQLKHKNDMIEKLKEENYKADREFKSDYQSSLNELKVKENTIDLLNQSIKQANIDIENLKKSCILLEQNLNISEKNEIKLKNEIHDLSSKLDKMTVEANKIKYECDLYREREKKVVCELSILKNKSETYQYNSERQINDISQLQDIINSLKKELDDVTNKKNKLDTVIFEKDKEIKMLQQESEMNWKNNQNLNNMSNRSLKIIKRLEDECRQLKGEVERNDINKEKFKIETSNQKEDMKYLIKENEKLRNDINSIIMLNNNQKLVINELKDNYSCVINENTYLKNEIVSYKHIYYSEFNQI